MINKNTHQYKSYWDTYYTKKLAPEYASGFARFALSFMQPGRKLIDLGCGNGRDSLYFASNDMEVTAIDMSETAIDTVRRGCGDLPVTIAHDDFVHSKVLIDEKYDYCYSRWTLHTIDDLQHADLLRNVWEALKDGGLFFVETRTISDDIYGLGREAGPHAFIYNEHYRRFIHPQDFSEQLCLQGFELLHFEEGRGFSKTTESDPVRLRVVAKRKG